MHILALRSWDADVDTVARRIADALGKTLPETRVRLLAGAPIVVATFGQAEAATAAADALRVRGLADLIELRGDETEGRPFVARDFDLLDSGLRVADHQTRYAIPYSEIELLLRGTHIEGHTTHDKTSTRALSLTRAVLSGGLMLTKKVTNVRTRVVEERTAFLNLYSAERPVVVLRETDLRFRSLGPALLPTRQANFQVLATELRRLAPTAIYDDRLAQRGGQFQLLGPGLPPDRYLDIALAVLARTLRRPV